MEEEAINMLGEQLLRDMWRGVATAAVNAQGADPRLERALAEIDDLRAENAALREDLRNVRAATVTVSASAPVVFPNPFADGGGYSETAALDLVAIAGIAGVDGMALDDVLSRFAPFADANGCLSRPSFRSAWGTLVAGVGMAERSAVLGAVDDLFEMFDMNGNQEVDMAELGSGLSVLCGGSRSEKARIAFQLYDYDGDGMISLAEMVRYLTPVFTIMYETSAGAQIVVNGAGSDDVSPAELALATALGAFSDAGVHRDGVLSWPQFRLWYLSTGDSATQQDAAVASAVDIVAFRQLTGLEDMSVASALDLFAESDLSRDPTSEISLDVFEECITSEVDVAALDERSASVLHVTIATIFRTFDLDSNGLVSFAELGAGLAMLCSGSGDEKARSAFNLYDINGDGVITLDEMRRYLFSVFSVMLESNPGASATYGNASELAAITAAEAFDAVGLPRDGSMSWLQFKAWYSSSHDDEEKGAGSAAPPPPPPPRRSAARPPPPPSPGSIAVADAAALTNGIDLNEARRLTGLGSIPMSEALLIFNARAAMDGELSRAAFNDCFNALAPEYEDELTAAEWAARDTVIAKLFTMFDSHHSGSIDVTEISVSLAILCTGAQDEKARAAFDLYDTNGDGVISFDEMVHYLESLFTVMFKSNPHTPEVMSGVSVQELALATAADAFGDIDTDHNGVLSWDEFKAWYGAASAESQAPIVVTPISVHGAPSTASYDRVAAIHEAEAIATGSVQGINLAEARQLTGLGGMAMRDALAIFYSRVAANGELSRAAFEDCFNAEELEVELSGPEWDARDAAISKLFALFDTHRTGSIDFTELGVGISILCQGAQDDKARAAFDLYDTNGDGVISFDEMVHYLESIFKLMFDANGASHEVMSGASAAEFALATAADAFGEIDTDHNGVLSWNEFRTWYSATAGAGAPIVATAIVGLQSPHGLAGARSSESVDSAASTVAAVPEPFDLGAASSLTGLDMLAPAVAIELFSNAVDFNGVVTLDNFIACFDTIATAPRARCIDTIARLFSLFDVDGNGVLTHQEVGSGLTVLCGGTRDEKASAAFALFDEDGDGVISLVEMQRYFMSVFTVMLHSGAHPVSDGVSVHELAFSTAKQAFTDADTDHDHVLSWEEFRAWYAPPGGEEHADASHGAASVALDALEPLDVAEASRLTGLGALGPDDALDLFRDALEDADGVISFGAFSGCFNEIVDASALTPTECAKLNRVIIQLFELFDADGNGVVDFTELGSGITVLCGGSRDEKARAAFELFDDNGDGIISLPEMVRYFTSVFTVMYTSSGGSHGVPEGVSAEELALETAIQAFAEADTDSSGALTWQEFHAWYSAQDDDDDQSDGEGSGGGAPNPMSRRGSEALDLGTVRRLTGLSSSSADAALSVFRRAADASGALDRDLFSSCFESIADASALSEDDIEELYMTVIPRLFDMFDTDTNGVVDFKELASGLSVLCGGSREDKVRIAFQLYDYDGDGVITFAEMTRYLTSVFSVMYETNPGAQANAGGVTAPELALATAEEAFAEADPGRTGQLTWEQFSAWFPNSPQGAQQPTLDLSDVSALTGLGSMSPGSAMAMFASSLGRDGTVSLGAFRQCFASRLAAISPTEQAKLSAAIDALYALFDGDGDGVVDHAELATGLSVLCGGTRDEKARAAFALYDANGDHLMSYDELQRYLSAVFTIMFAQTQNADLSAAAQLAEDTAIEAFAEADVDLDACLTWEMFRTWYSAHVSAPRAPPPPPPPRAGARGVGRRAPPPPPPQGSAMQTARPSEGGLGLDLDSIRRVTGLGDCTPYDVLEEFTDAAARDGSLSLAAFTQCFDAIVDVSLMSAVESSSFHQLLKRLYTLFDSDGNGTVDVTELSAGLSVLCGGSRDEKARAVFDLFDTNGDGVMSEEEMTHYFTAVFKVSFETRGAQGTSVMRSRAEIVTLARSTAAAAFAVADADHDGSVTWDEFRVWFSNSGGGARTKAAEFVNPMASGDISSGGASSSSSLDFSAVRRITGLGTHTVDGALRVFHKAAGDTGTLSSEAFASCFDEIVEISALSECEVENLFAITIPRLFVMFDADGNGVVDFTELASGLSVLCGGSREDKARIAFQLYDYDGDGVITLEEMTRYLTSVFSVMYATNPSAQASAGGLSVPELAVATAEEAFAEADVDGTGELTWENFYAWFP